MKRLPLLLSALLFCVALPAQEMLFDDGWKFAFGDAASPEKDFGRGTEYFNYFTKESRMS